MCGRCQEVSSDWRVSAAFCSNNHSPAGKPTPLFYGSFLFLLIVGPNYCWFKPTILFQPIHHDVSLSTEHHFCHFFATNLVLCWQNQTSFSRFLLLPQFPAFYKPGGSVHLFIQSLSEKSGLLWCTIEVKAQYRLAILSFLSCFWKHRRRHQQRHATRRPHLRLLTRLN